MRHHFRRLKMATTLRMPRMSKGRPLMLSHWPVKDIFKVHSGANRLTCRFAELMAASGTGGTGGTEGTCGDELRYR